MKDGKILHQEEEIFIFIYLKSINNEIFFLKLIKFSIKKLNSIKNFEYLLKKWIKIRIQSENWNKNCVNWNSIKAKISSNSNSSSTTTTTKFFFKFEYKFRSISRKE